MAAILLFEDDLRHQEEAQEVLGTLGHTVRVEATIATFNTLRPNQPDVEWVLTDLFLPLATVPPDDAIQSGYGQPDHLAGLLVAWHCREVGIPWAVVTDHVQHGYKVEVAIQLCNAWRVPLICALPDELLSRRLLAEPRQHKAWAVAAELLTALTDQGLALLPETPRPPD